MKFQRILLRCQMEILSIILSYCYFFALIFDKYSIGWLFLFLLIAISFSKLIEIIFLSNFVGKYVGADI